MANTDPIVFRAPPPLVAALKRYAHRHQQSLSDAIRDILREKVDPDAEHAEFLRQCAALAAADPSDDERAVDAGMESSFTAGLADAEDQE